LNIVILDACRNNPFARSFRSVRNGLASIDAPSGTLIAYATAPGSVAIDGEGDNGLYTSELLNAMRESGNKIEDVFKRVRIAVQAKSNGRQIPWESSSLVGDFYFSGTGAVATSGPAAVNSPPVAPKVMSLTDIDRTNPASTATAILQAYRTRDIVALSALSRARNKEILANIIKNGENDGRYRSLFSATSWRWQSAQQWTGQLDEVRYSATRLGEPPTEVTTAIVKFGEMSPDSVLVVTLIMENGQWCFEDLNKPSRAMFESLSKAKQD